MIAVSYLDGNRLSRSLIAGARFVADRAEALNQINVFPVADGDTGTNVAATLQKIAAVIARTRQRDIRRMSRTIADEAVGSARGNSGAILAQFFCGFSEGLPATARVGTREFADAAVRASASAYSAIARPVEGTILTVIRDWARHVAERAARVPDFGVLLPDSLQAARLSLQNTPRQMPMLKKAGVVDAGAQGFVYLLEGIVRYLRESAGLAPPSVEPVDLRAAKFELMPEAILFRYCTEVLVEGDAIDRDGLRREGALLGDSIVLAGGATRIRLHIHTNEPERLFEAARRFGEVAQTKVEDMRAQHESRFDQNRAARVGIVTDSTCDLPASMLEDLGVGVVPVRVYFGSENYLDKVTITPAEFYARFSVTDVAPKTSQPRRRTSRRSTRTSRSTPAPSCRCTSRRTCRERTRPRSSARARWRRRRSSTSTAARCPWGSAWSCARPRRWPPRDAVPPKSRRRPATPPAACARSSPSPRSSTWSAAGGSRPCVAGSRGCWGCCRS